MNTMRCHMYELATQGAPDLLLRLQKNSGPKIIIISECHESPSDQVPYLSTCNIGCSFRSADPPPTQHVLRTKAFKYRPSTPYHRAVQCSAVQYIKQDGWMVWGQETLFWLCLAMFYPSTCIHLFTSHQVPHLLTQ